MSKAHAAPLETSMAEDRPSLFSRKSFVNNNASFINKPMEWPKNPLKLAQSSEHFAMLQCTINLDDSAGPNYVALHNLKKVPRFVERNPDPGLAFRFLIKGRLKMAAAKKSANSNEQFDAFSMMSPELFKEGYEKFAKSLSSFADFNKESLEAVMTSADVYAKGLEQATSEQTAFAKEAFEEGIAMTKAATTASSVQEALEIQTEYARTAFEKNLGFASKLAEHWSTVSKNAVGPLSKRYGDFVEMAQTYRP